MEIYHDILNAIQMESANGNVKPSRVQSHCNLAYDKLSRYLTELEDKNMITKDPLALAEKGQDFLQDYSRIKDFVDEIGIKYLDFSEGKT